MEPYEDPWGRDLEWDPDTGWEPDEPSGWAESKRHDAEVDRMREERHFGQA